MKNARATSASSTSTIPIGWFDRVWDPLSSQIEHPCCARFIAKYKIAQLHSWRESQTVFVGVHDLFHGEVPDVVIGDLYCVMARHPHLRFKVLTRDPYRMEQWFGCGACYVAQQYLLARGIEYPAPNIALGVLADDQMAADERLGALLGATAAVRFVVLHQLKEPVDLTQIECPSMVYTKEQVRSCSMCSGVSTICKNGVYNALAEGIDEIVLGEIAADAHRFEFDWHHDLVEQCRTFGVSVIIPRFYL